MCSVVCFMTKSQITEGNKNMSEQDSAEFLEKKIKDRIDSVKDRIDFYRRNTIRFTMLSAFLSAATTALIGVGQIYNWQLLSVIALIISASMTIVHAWNGLFKYRSRWVNNNEALMQLYELRTDIEYQKIRQTLQGTTIDEFYQRYKLILQAANESWKYDRLPQEQKT